MHYKIVILAGLLSLVSCQKSQKEEESAREADFEKMVIIQDGEDAKTIGSESGQDLKIR